MAISETEGLPLIEPEFEALIGDKLKALREAEGLKLAEVANAVGTTIATLSAVETSRIANPGYQLVYSLAKYYGITVEELIDGPVEGKVPTSTTEKLSRRLTTEEDQMASSYLKYLIAQRAQR